MNLIKKYWGYVVAAITAIISLLLLLLSKKNKDLEELQTKIDLATTQKDADILEVQIKQLKDNKDNLDKDNKELDKLLEQVQNKRSKIEDDAKKLKDPKEIAEYWNNQ